MGFNPFKIFKSLLISQENTLNPKMVEIVPGGNANTKTTLTTSQTSDHTITFPDAPGTVVLKDTTDTLTSKTIDAASNTISNLADANIKAGANIALNKLNPLTVSKVAVTDGSGVLTTANTTPTEINYVSGVTSSLQTQLNNKAAKDLSNILPTTAINVNAQRITNGADPVNPQDFATKNYIDNAGSGANTTLSNLTSPTAINQSLIPGVNKTLGTTGSAWSSLTVENIYGTSIGDNFDVTNRRLKDTGNNISIDYQIRQLKSGTTTKLDWSGTDLDVNTRKIINGVDPTASQHFATKNYVDTTTASLAAFSNIGKTFYIYSSGVLVNNLGQSIIYSTIATNDFGGTPYNFASGAFTFPLTGKYMIVAGISGSGSFSTSQTMTIQMNIIGSGILASDIVYGSGGGSQVKTPHVSQVIRAAASSQLVIQGISDIALNLNNIQAVNYLTITYLGA
jgi:hypothetical protein